MPERSARRRWGEPTRWRNCCRSCDSVDRVSHTVKRNGREVDLSLKEFALLEFLMRHAGQAVPRSAIVEHVWKLHFDTITNVIDVYINYLRRKVDTGYDRAVIRTIRGVGYQIGGNVARRATVAASAPASVQTAH
jgi:DNA-binding response OmpR family regulator